MPRLLTSSILDADVAVAGRWLAEAWGWWTEQLKACVPRRLRRTQVAGTIAWLTPEGGLRFTRAGKPIEASRAAGGPAVLALPDAQCLLRELTMPALGEADVRRAVRLDLERLMPFPRNMALAEIEVGPVVGEARQVVIAALPIAAAEAALEAGLRAYVRPSALALLSGDGAIRFDFLPQLRALRGEPDLYAERRFWWRTVLALLVLNIVVLVVADVRTVHALGVLVETHGELAERVLVKQRFLLSEQSQRQSLAVRRMKSDPLPVLAALSAQLPGGAWLKRLELERGHGRVVGVRSETADVIGALRRNPQLRNVRASSVDVLARTAAGQPFDISFDLAR